MRIVLDTNTVVSALLWHGVPHALVSEAGTRPVVFLTSPVLLAELEDVLARPKLAAAVNASGLTIAELMQRYLGLTTVVASEALDPPVLDDPDDDHVLACALVGKADAIVSGDRGLLQLGSFRGIPILTAPQCLQRLASE